MEKRLIRRKRLVPQPGNTSQPGRIILDIENAMVFRRPPPDHPSYALIGQITMRWSFIEEFLDICIGTLADTNPAITACITAQMMGHGPRCLTIKALAHWRGLSEIEKATDGLQNALYEASERRNRAIHDLLLIETKTNATFKDHRMSKKELHYGLKECYMSELKNTLALIIKRGTDCVNILNMIRKVVY
jgi:hypothetical protein